MRLPPQSRSECPRGSLHGRTVKCLSVRWGMALCFSGQQKRPSEENVVQVESRRLARIIQARAHGLDRTPGFGFQEKADNANHFESKPLCGAAAFSLVEKHKLRRNSAKGVLRVSLSLSDTDSLEPCTAFATAKRGLHAARLEASPPGAQAMGPLRKERTRARQRPYGDRRAIPVPGEIRAEQLGSEWKPWTLADPRTFSWSTAIHCWPCKPWRMCAWSSIKA